MEDTTPHSITNKSSEMEDTSLLPLKSKEGITQHWLEKVLSHKMKTSAILISWKVREQEEKVGIASEIVFVDASFTTQGEQNEEVKWERSLVVKLYPKDKSKVESMKIRKFGEREMQLYKYTAEEEFITICQKSGLPEIVPRVYWAGISDEALTIVMPNMRSENYEVMVPPEGIMLDKVMTVLEAIATVHAASFFAIETRGKHFLDLPWDNAFQGKQVLNGIDLLIPLYSGTPLETTLQALKQHVPELLRVAQKYPGLATLIHGDLWTGNILFGEDGQRACIIDWQFTHIGNPVCDLLTLLLMSSKPAVYSDHLAEILECYWTKLEDVLGQIGIKSKLSLTLQDFTENVEDLWIYGFMFFCAAYPHLKSFNMITSSRAIAVVSFLENRGTLQTFLASN